MNKKTPLLDTTNMIAAHMMMPTTKSSLDEWKGAHVINIGAGIGRDELALQLAALTEKGVPTVIIIGDEKPDIDMLGLAGMGKLPEIHCLKSIIPFVAPEPMPLTAIMRDEPIYPYVRQYHGKSKKKNKGPKVDGVRRETPKISRNALCSCGSGKKYKRCCLDK